MGDTMQALRELRALLAVARAAEFAAKNDWRHKGADDPACECELCRALSRLRRLSAGAKRRDGR